MKNFGFRILELERNDANVHHSLQTSSTWHPLSASKGQIMVEL